MEVRSPSPLTPARPRRILAAARKACMSLVSTDKGQAGDGRTLPLGSRSPVSSLADNFGDAAAKRSAGGNQEQAAVPHPKSCHSA